MGEYLRRHKEQVKLGTCESLYYTRYAEFSKNLWKFDNDGSATPQSYLQPNVFRFRFPFPDEDTKFQECGNWSEPNFNFDRGYLIRIPKSYGVEIAHGTKFHRIDLKDQQSEYSIGYKTKCPMSEEFEGSKFLWGNESFIVFEIVAQKHVKDEEVNELQTVVRCPYCGEMCRLSKAEAEALVLWCKETKQSEETEEIVKRVIAGYTYFD